MWFWNQGSIENKKYRNYVLDLNGIAYLWGFHDGANQNFFLVDDEIVVNGNLRIEEKDGKIIDNEKTGEITQKWSWILEKFANSIIISIAQSGFWPNINYFAIIDQDTGKILDATSTYTQLTMSTNHGGDTQLWFWDNDTLRSKKYPEFTIDIDTT